MQVFDRTALVDHCLTALRPDGSEAESWEVGDHEKPKSGGWQGDPGRSAFVAYVVLTSLATQRPQGSLGQPGENAVFPMALTSIGSSRRQASLLSDLARTRMAELARTDDAAGQRIQSVDMARHGGVDRVSMDPPVYSITDTVHLWSTLS